MVLEFQNVNGTDRGFCLKDITFSAESGYLTGIAGKNGAGKTTLLHYIADAKKHYTGSIRFLGQELHENHTKLLNQIAFVADEAPFFKLYTGRQNIKILSPLYETWDTGRFAQAVENISASTGKKLKLDAPLSKLSRGEYLRFQMAFAMAHQTKLYLLDEVTGGMDPVFRREFFRLLHRILEQEDVSILMTTHMEEELEKKVDYVGMLEEGRLKSFGMAGQT